VTEKKKRNKNLSGKKGTIVRSLKRGEIVENKGSKSAIGGPTARGNVWMATKIKRKSPGRSPVDDRGENKEKGRN